MTALDALSELNEAADQMAESFETLAKQAWIGFKKVEDARYF